MADLVQPSPCGMYCPAGDFYIDPRRAVDRAVITHAHSDHARPGSKHYLCSKRGEELLRLRIGMKANISSMEYGETVAINGVKVSLHPAGHLLGSAQIRVEHRGEVWVVSGDYKLHDDPTCQPFEAVRCHVFITESTFGLPIYRWQDPQTVFDDINAWWGSNRQNGRNSVIFAYAIGKAQHVLAGVDASIGPIMVHKSIDEALPAYRAAEVRLPDVQRLDPEILRRAKGRALIVTPQGGNSPGRRAKYAPYSTATASGWARVRRMSRGRSIDRSFVLSDHADWPGLLEAIDASGAERIGVMHGYTDALVRYLNEQRRDAWNCENEFRTFGV